MDKDVETSWITQEFLEDILHGQDDTSDVVVTGRDIEPAVSKGDNYMSILYRVGVHFKRPGSDQLHTRHLIIKVLPSGEFLQAIVNDMGLFKREADFFTLMSPAFTRLQGSFELSPLSARLLRNSRPDTLVLEDLRPQGFVMANRRNRLDLQHCLLVVRSQARLHGLSAVLFHREPAMLTDFRDTMYVEENREHTEGFMHPQMLILADLVETWPGYERFGPKIRDLKRYAVDRLLEVCKPIKGGFTVLVHGDCWINNMLFKYSSSREPVDFRFVDFQISRTSSPAFDLQYFLWTSPQDAVRDEYWDHLLEEYHKTLCSVVHELEPNLEVLSLQQLHKDMKRSMIFGFLSAQTILAAVVGEPEDSPDMSEIKTEDVGQVDAFEKIHSSPQFREAFQNVLVAFEKFGLFELGTVNTNGPEMGHLSTLPKA